MITTEGIELLEGNVADVQDSYKYNHGKWHHEEAPWRSATAKYLQRVKQVPKCQLNGKHKVQAINTSSNWIPSWHNILATGRYAKPRMLRQV